MQDEQIALAVILGVLLGPVPFIVLAIYLCCWKDICHLRGNTERQSSYMSMQKLDSLGGEDKEGENNSNPDQVFSSPVAPQIEQ